MKNSDNKSVMIIWSGAREHVLAEAYAASEKVSEVVVAPWNDFMLTSPKISIEKEVVLKDVDSILIVADVYRPSLIDVAQDDALSLWSVDRLRKKGFQVFGPTQNAARIEWDKKWAREFMKKYGLPVPEFQYFTKETIKEAKYFSKTLLEKYENIFLKANGLHAWKWVVWLGKENFDKEFKNFEKILSPWEWFLVEQWLVWEEFSYYAMIDGNNSIFFPSAQDNKRVFNGDRWPNTWWMWCHSPASITEEYEDKIQDIIRKVVTWMKEEWHPYTWILYFGGMIWADNKVNIIEFNARWWDPETQVVLPALEKDYFDLVYNYALPGKLNKFHPSFFHDKRVCVVGTADPYPSSIESEKGKKIIWLEGLTGQEIKIFGAWMKDIWNNEFGVNGWRLFSAVSRGDDFLKIRNNIHDALGNIWIDKWKLHYRTDVAEREIKRR